MTIKKVPLYAATLVLREGSSHVTELSRIPSKEEQGCALKTAGFSADCASVAQDWLQNRERVWSKANLPGCHVSEKSVLNWIFLTKKEKLHSS
jgi:hypothetical protein